MSDLEDIADAARENDLRHRYAPREPNPVAWGLTFGVGLAIGFLVSYGLLSMVGIVIARQIIESRH